MQPLHEAIYHLALDIFIEYRQIMSYGRTLSSKFIWIGNNVFMKTVAITPEYDYLFKHIEDLNIEELVSSNIPSDEFRELSDILPVRHIMLVIFTKMSKPMFLRSNQTYYPKSFAVSIPDVVLYIAETMINEQVNIQFQHYFNIDRSMFDRYMHTVMY